MSDQLQSSTVHFCRLPLPVHGVQPHNGHSDDGANLRWIWLAWILGPRSLVLRVWHLKFLLRSNSALSGRSLVSFYRIVDLLSVHDCLSPSYSPTRQPGQPNPLRPEIVYIWFDSGDSGPKWVGGQHSLGRPGQIHERMRY